MVDNLLEKGANVTAIDKDGNIPLYMAINSGKPLIIKIARLKRMSLKEIYTTNFILIGNDKMIDLLFKHDVNLNEAKQNSGETILMIATKQGDSISCNS